MSGFVSGHVVRESGVAEPVENDESDGVSFIFLVRRHRTVESIEGKGGRVIFHRDGANKVVGTVSRDGVGVASVGKVEAGSHAHGDSFSVREGPVARHGLNGMGKGMSKVENSPAAFFSFVGTHNICFHLYGAFDRRRHCFAIAPGQDRFEVRFEVPDEVGVSDEGVFHDLGHAACILVHRKRVEGGRVGTDQKGLVKCANQIFPCSVVDGRLASHGRVDLSEEGGGQVHEGHAAQESGRGKAGQVSNDTAPQREDGRLAINAPGQGFVVDRLEMSGRFCRLARGQDDRFDGPACLLESGYQWRPVVGSYVFIRDQQTPTGPQVGRCQQLWKCSEGTKVNVVAPLTEIDVDSHGSKGIGKQLALKTRVQLGGDSLLP